jgi:curved DNA-binding protein CbpA
LDDSRRYNSEVPKRSSYEVLGVDIDASAATIKARWRRLAREHHPDLTGGDGQASRAATRTMAEINAAYEELRDPARRRLAAERARASGGRDGRRDDGVAGATSGAATNGSNGAGPSTAAGPGNAGPPRPRPGRPVTARLDTSDTYAPRNSTVGSHGRRAYRASAGPPFRAEPKPAEPPRASDPTGPLRRARMRHFRPPPTPELAEAHAYQVEFGKFRGHTLGEIAAFEPSYIDWIASTITKDRDLVAAARVIKDDLDVRGVPRIRRPLRPGPSPLL